MKNFKKTLNNVYVPNIDNLHGDVYMPMLDDLVLSHEVLGQVKRIKCNKVSGSDGVPPSVFR